MLAPGDCFTLEGVFGDFPQLLLCYELLLISINVHQRTKRGDLDIILALEIPHHPAEIGLSRLHAFQGAQSGRFPFVRPGIPALIIIEIPELLAADLGRVSGEKGKDIRRPSQFWQFRLQPVKKRLEQIIPIIGVVTPVVLTGEIQGVGEPDDIPAGKANRRAAVSGLDLAQGTDTLRPVGTTLSGYGLQGNTEY